MNFHQNNEFLIFLLLNIFSQTLTSYPQNYTVPYLYSVRIGSQSTEIKLLLNSFSSNNVLFSNSNRIYSKEISKGRMSDVYIDKLEFNGQIIPEFPFSLILDNTGLNSPEIQGEFGLGIDKDNRNDLIENLFINQIIARRKIILETSNDLKNNKIELDTESIANEFKYCNLTRKADLDNFYSEAWVCELSHLIEGESDIKSLQLNWEKAEEIKGRALFDTRQKYIILPIKYLEKFERFWHLNNSQEILDKSLNLKYLKCDNRTYEKIKNQNHITFIIDGYGIEFSFDELFENEGNFKKSLIRFTDTINNSNLFIFGIPLFKKYKIMLDYENKRVGLKGEIIDFTEFYNEWKEEEVIKIHESNAISMVWTNEKIIMGIGTIIGGLIILYILFSVIRESKRNNENKIHSKFIEQVKDY